ncbi:MAG: phosphatidylglycerol lysyltransferase domain-containing protein, partial [Treponema sp.]|nr:phosphatidylglycerol lysyltransferase domain-containing protein [Treponema sp.]
TILTNWEKFPCKGLKLYVDGKICAFSVFSRQTNDMAAVHFEKYDPEIKGAGQVINQETAKFLENDYKFINREEDLGFAGIRQAKRSYQPSRMLPYYKLKGK